MAINSVGTNNFVGFTQPTFNTQQTTQTGQTGFQAGSTFGTGQANFAALGSPDLASGGGLAQVITALKDIVSALGTLVKALQAQQAGGAEGAQAKPAEGGAGGTENAQAKPAATDNIAPGEQNAQTKPADGGAGGAAPAGGTGGTGGADAAQAGGDKMSALMQMLPNLLQVLQQLIEALSGNKDEEAKADGAKKNGKGGGAHTTHASDKAKQHAAANSAVGQQAAMEKIQQAVTQLLGAIVQMLVPLLKELTSSMGGEQNPQAQAAATQVNDALKNLGGGGMLGGVLQR
ncbi:MAG TPA: hypothetical protein VND93_15155 [Myxococcales bacterium]|nr:hypothetical protein [Myxococcales bacterium]